MDTGKNFPIEKKWPNSPVDLQSPKIVGYWSLDGSRTFRLDSSQLRYYIPFSDGIPTFNLNDGLSRVEKRADSLDDEKLENILRWIEGNRGKILADDGRLRPDFICYRGPLAKILKSPYQEQCGWMINAVKFDGTIYMCPFDTEEDKEWYSNQPEWAKNMSFWGKRFEQYMLSDTPYHRGSLSEPVNESEEFCCVFESCINDHRLLYAAEVDGLCSDEKFEDPLPLDQLKFMELKTDTLTANTERQVKKKKERSLKWWAQSYLVGVENIVCGCRDNRGIVRRLEEKLVSGLERESQEVWNSSVCMNFCDEFLTFMKQTVKKNYDETIYKFERRPGNDNVIVTELPVTPQYAFLPDWYISLAKKGRLSHPKISIIVMPLADNS